MRARVFIFATIGLALAGVALRLRAFGQFGFWNDEAWVALSTRVDDFEQFWLSLSVTPVLWAATLRAGRLLARIAVPDPPSQRRLRAAINSVVEQVAHDLHNTPAVCRRSYICPTVFDDWIEGRLPLKWSGRRA